MGSRLEVRHTLAVLGAAVLLPGVMALQVSIATPWLATQPESTPAVFATLTVGCCAVGGLALLAGRWPSHFGLSQALVAAALSWIVVCIIGGLPFYMLADSDVPEQIAT